MIDINKLTEKDKGRWVKYTDGSGRSELGRLKSWNDTFIFVVYKYGDEWYRFFDYTGQATRPSDLCFIDDERWRMKYILSEEELKDFIKNPLAYKFVDDFLKSKTPVEEIESGTGDIMVNLVEENKWVRMYYEN